MKINCPVCESEERTTIGITGALPIVKYKYVCKDCSAIYQYELETKILGVTVIDSGIPILNRK